jgi:hypothetical protein
MTFTSAPPPRASRVSLPPALAAALVLGLALAWGQAPSVACAQDATLTSGTTSSGATTYGSGATTYGASVSGSGTAVTYGVAGPGAVTSGDPSANPYQETRIWAEIGMGFGAATLIGPVGGLIGAFIGGNVLDPSQNLFSTGGFVGGLVGHSLVALATIPIAIDLAGSWNDGRGALWAAYVGELVGAATAGAFIAGAVGAQTNELYDLGAVLYGIGIAGAILFPQIGAIVGYELSDASARASGASARSSGPVILPTAGFDGQRFTLGAVGMF